MIFRRFSVISGTYLAHGKNIFPITSSRASCVAEINAPRRSGRALKALGLPEPAITLFMVLALCHTVRVESVLEQESAGGDVSSATAIAAAKAARKRQRKEARQRHLKAFRHLLMDPARKKPPKRGLSLLRRASAMQAAGEAVSSIRRVGKARTSGEEINYQV